MVHYLPDTALCSVVMENTVYTYAQGDTGALLELQGTLELKKGTSVTTYAYDISKTIKRRYRRDEADNDAPKLFTPLAVTAFAPNRAGPQTDRHLFYVDDSSEIRGMIYQNRSWVEDEGLKNLHIRCAAYSRLAAISVPNDNQREFICLYYQDSGKEAAIKTANYEGYNKKWVLNKPDLRDPPLYGTSLKAVRPRLGVLVAEPGSDDARQPVLYLQLDNLKLAHAQGGEPAEIPGFEIDGTPMVFSPHTSLAAVDDGNVLYIIYKSNSNAIKMIRANEGRPLMKPVRFTDELIQPTPSGAISACLSPDKRQIIVFYRSLNRVTMKIDLYGLTLYKTSTTSDDAWTYHSPPEKLED